jgi:uncharacterized membrane protein
MVQNRFKSVVTWTALVALVLNILVQCGVILPDQGNAISGALSGILNCLVVFGILNNPKDPTNF